jgi:hypothetical protein
MRSEFIFWILAEGRECIVFDWLRWRWRAVVNTMMNRVLEPRS